MGTVLPVPGLKKGGLSDPAPAGPSPIRIGHSPDADDAFMFWALAKGKLPLEGFQIEHVVEDIETLNQWALGVGMDPSARPQGSPRQPPLHVTALSCHAFGFLSDRYQLIPYGASVGENYGPVIVGKKKRKIRGKRIAVPGRYTTAHLVLQLYEPDFVPVFVPFDKIFQVLEEGEADFGLLIHEGQLTYQEKGFEKVLDLGEWWFGEFRLPLPLGINAIRRDLEEETKIRFTRLFLKSIEYAMTHRQEAMHYALQFGRGIDRKRGDRFVGMYVNDFSLELGERGLAGLRTLFELGWENKIFPTPVRFEVLPSLPSKNS